MGEQMISLTLSEYQRLNRERAAGLRAWAYLTAAMERDRTKADYKSSMQGALDILDVVFK